MCGPGLGASPPSRRTRARASVSFNSELLPEPLTPVTQTRAESGNCTVTFLRLLVVTPSMRDRAGLGDAAAARRAREFARGPRGSGR